MTARQLRSWRKRLALTQERAAAALGIHRLTLISYEVGRLAIPQLVVLACEALERRHEDAA